MIGFGEFQVGEHIMVLRGWHDQRGHGGSVPLLPYLALCISSIWLLFLSWILHSKLVKINCCPEFYELF